jgi:methylamine---glutamate N-methyltransferase subunit A
MCGIVGLHLKNPDLEDRLGALLAPMLDCMGSRGPDSAGIALYRDDLPDGVCRYSLRADAGIDWDAVAAEVGERIGGEATVEAQGVSAVLRAAGTPDGVLDALEAGYAEVTVVGFGAAIEVFKDVGAPREIAERYGIADRGGYQGIGHTRMATESAVTTEHSHPFVPAADVALVHNGSFSNYASVRRQLAARDIRCLTDNDSEVAARYLALQMSEGADLGDALRMAMKTMDGFFTLLVGTRTQFAVLRDSFACKPLVVAECDDYVAVASEFQALASLPGVRDASVFEPMPEEVHVWTR